MPRSTIFFKQIMLTYQLECQLPRMLKKFTIFTQKRNFLIYGMRLLLKLMLIQDKHDVIIIKHCFKAVSSKKQLETTKYNERRNTKLYAIVSDLQPENSNFLDVNMVQPLLHLVDRTVWNQNLMLLKRTLQNWTLMRRQSRKQPNSFLDIARHLRWCLH